VLPGEHAAPGLAEQVVPAADAGQMWRKGDNILPPAPWPAGPRGRHREPAAVSGTARPGAAAGARDAVIPGMALAAIQINPFSRNVAETVETGA
jgi:hypothetical protein